MMRIIKLLRQFEHFRNGKRDRERERERERERSSKIKRRNVEVE